MKTKILYLINSLKSAGAERVVLNIAKYINKDKFEPIITYFEPWHSLRKKFEDLGILTYCLNIRNKLDPTGLLKLIHILRREKPKILHTHLPYAGIIGRLIGRFVGIPCIISTQHNVPTSFKRITYLLDKVTLPMADLVTCVSEGIEEQLFSSVYVFTGHEKYKKHLTLWNGIDFEEIDKIKNSPDNLNCKKWKHKRIVLMPGRLLKWKGQHILLKAWPEVKKKIKNACLLIVGDGPEKNNLRQMIQDLAISESVRLLGERTDIYSLMKIAEVVVTPYYYKGLFHGEGVGLVVLEGMAMGKVVISSKVPNIEKAIEHRITGLLFPQGDYKTLAGLIIEVLENSEFAKFIGRNARKRAKERFDAKVMAYRYEILYKSILEEKNA